jgi:hypothetical protein
MNITSKGNAFMMAWCLQCHRAPQNYLYPETNSSGTAVPGRTPRQKVFDLYWKIQENGLDGLDEREMKLATGEDPISTKPEDVAVGRKLVNQYGIKVQQLADCWVCHR